MKKAHERSHYRFRRITPAFPAQWFYGLLRALPGDQACLTPSPALLIADLTPASGRQNHTTSPSASAQFVKRTARVHRIPPHVGDVRNAPLPGRDDEGCRSDLGPLASEISEFQKLVARPSRRLPLRLDRILGNRLICPGRAKSVHPVLRAKTIFLLRSCRLPSRSPFCGKTRSNEGAA